MHLIFISPQKCVVTWKKSKGSELKKAWNFSYTVVARASYLEGVKTDKSQRQLFNTKKLPRSP